MQINNLTSQSRILVIELEQADENILNIDIPDQRFSFKKLSLETLRTETDLSDFTLAIVDCSNESGKVIATIEEIRQINADMPIVLLADPGDELIIEQTFKMDSIELLFKPVTPKVLLSKIKTICDHHNSKKELLYLRQQVAMTYGFDNFVGLSREIMKIKRNIQHVAANDTTVILTGEDGTGKNLLAKIIHYHSARRHSPFVSFDCSAFTSNQLEREIFGTVRADSKTPGIFERTENGTLFIDKIHLLNNTLQEQLENHIRQTTDVRIIFSANDTVFDMVEKGTVNKTLIECLNAVEFALPPLSRRTEDIELITAYFLRLIAYENESANLTITPAAIEMLKRHNWPGNVRELENCLRRAAALCTDNKLDIADISFISIGTTDSNLRDFVNDRQSKKASLAESQRFLIAEALDSNEWNFTQTAKQLGIGRTTLWRKVRKFKLSKETSNRMQSSGVTTYD